MTTKRQSTITNYFQYSASHSDDSNMQQNQSTTEDFECLQMEMLLAMAKVDEQGFSDESVDQFFNSIDHINQRICNRMSTKTTRPKSLASENFLASKSGKLNMYIQNAHSIRGKVDELRLATSSSPFEIIVITETWLNDSISNAEHFNAKYDVHRCDRTILTKDRIDGGGVLIAVDASLNGKRILLPDSDGLEYVCVKITIGASNVFVFAVYIRSVHERDTFILFADVVKQIPFNENDAVIVCGDFNQE